MKDLPAVKDDSKSMKLCVQMLNIPPMNIFEFSDINYKKMKGFHEEFMMKILALSKPLR